MADRRASGMKRLLSCLLAAATVCLVLLPLTVPSSASEVPVLEHGDHACVYNIENDRMLYAYNERESIYPAAMTKLMTAILAIENLGNDWDREITVPAEASRNVQGNRISLKEGEIVTVGDIIHAIIVGNANDAALTAAIEVSGSVDAFVSKMNRRAEELGCTGTHFMNPTGLQDSRQTTTLSDMLKICTHAYHLNGFISCSSLERYVMKPTNLVSSERRIVNKNYFVSNTVVSKYYLSSAIGMCAGFTEEAGHCVILVAAKEGSTQIVIVTGADADDDYDYAYVEARRLLDWSFETYDYIDVLSSARIICEVPVKMSGKVDHVTLLPQESVTQYMDTEIDVVNDVVIDWTLYDDWLLAPVERGQVCGELRLYYNGEVLATVGLVAQNTVDRDEWLYFFSSLWNWICRPKVLWIAAAIVVCGIGYVFATAYFRDRRRRKRAQSMLRRW